MPQETEPHIPDRKVSETLLDYAAPLLEFYDEGVEQEAFWKAALNTAVVVWNAVLHDQNKNTTHYTDLVKRTIRQGRPEMIPVIEMMIERKKEDFDDDPRFITDFKVKSLNGQITCRAEARL